MNVRQYCSETREMNDKLVFNCGESSKLIDALFFTDRHYVKWLKK